MKILYKFQRLPIMPSVFLLIILLSVPSSLEFENVGRVVRGQLESLYNLRSKLGSVSSSIIPSTTVGTLSPAASVKKESRGYAFHYSPSEITLPSYSSAYSSSSIGGESNSFSSRVGKLDESQTQPISMKKLPKVKSDKYSKHSSSKLYSKDSNNALNSFNVHQNSIKSTPTTTTTTTSTTQASILSSSSMDFQKLGQGLNNAMTAVVTQKLMNMLDQDVPQGLLNPLKHLVASGNRMVDFWDKRTIARDGKKPGFIEMLGYGLDQLKGFRDGQTIKSSDPVANITSPSQTLIQGMITVKRLTNRVLGYDTSNEVESRGGYGHDSYGHGGYGQMSYGSGGMYGGLDPFSLLAALAFGAFLLQLLLTLLNSSARSLNVVDLNTPLMMSDFHLPSFLSSDKYFGTPTVRNKREAYVSTGEEENLFYSVVDKLDGLYKTYKQVSEKPKCAKLHLCRLAVDEAYTDESSLLSPVYIFGLGQVGKDHLASQFVQQIKDRVINGEDVDCDKIVKDCELPNQ